MSGERSMPARGLERHPYGKRRLGRAAKRAFDVAVAALALVLLSPALLVIALLVRITIGRPVLFKQVRPGLRGRSFVLWKFRTMNNATDERGAQLPDESRITRVGRFLRQTSLDELPELVNVLRGEMSLVGPRPLLPEYMELYTPEQQRRHEMPPGITGPAQISGRNSLSWDEKFLLDLDYIDNWSLMLDLKILVRSVRAVVSRSGISAQGHATMPRFQGEKSSTTKEVK